MLGIFDLLCMADGDWRQRLRALVDASGRSMRDISLKAGVSAGYLHGVLMDDKDPSIGRLAAICEELNVSVSQVMYGVEMTGGAERMLRLYTSLTEDQREHLLLLAESARKLRET